MARSVDVSNDPVAVPIPEGRYQLAEGTEVVLLIPSGELWEATIRVCTQEATGAIHRIGMRRGLTGFDGEGDWCIVETMTVPLLVRVDDLAAAN